MINRVRARAPGAQIVLVGYLPAIPAAGSGICDAVPLSLTDAERMRSVAIRLAQVIGAVAGAAGFPVVRSSVIGTGHDACSTQPFVARAHPSRGRLPWPITPTRPAWMPSLRPLITFWTAPDHCNRRPGLKGIPCNREAGSTTDKRATRTWITKTRDEHPA